MTDETSSYICSSFTVIYRSGRANFYDSAPDYFWLLNELDSRRIRKSDPPEMLLRNGKVVVASGLHEISNKYCERKEQLLRQAYETLFREFKPEWIEDVQKDT